jgi:hypothetical protein
VIEVLEFWQRWRLSECLLTITGSYEEDKRRYSDFWRDVMLIDLLYAKSEEFVNGVIDTVKNG